MPLPSPLAAAANVLHRYAEAVASPSRVRAGLRSYPRFLRERREYRTLPGAKPLERSEDLPQLFDRTESTPYDRHYTFQDGWAAREVIALGPNRHVDVASRISFVVGLSALVPTTFVDIRPPILELTGLTVVSGDLTDLPFADASIESLSCLHVIEHVGLGRYGDALDPRGPERAARELQRVVAEDGMLLIGVPVGRPRIQFNAHRIFDPEEVPGLFPGLRLDSFAGVTDAGQFLEGIEPSKLRGSRFACGLYRFRRD